MDKQSYKSKIRYFLASLLLFVLLIVPTSTKAWNPFDSLASIYSVQENRSFLGSVWCFTKIVFNFGESCVDVTDVATEERAKLSTSETKQANSIINKTVATTSIPVVLGTSTESTSGTQLKAVTTPAPVYNSNYYTTNEYVTNEYITNPVTLKREVVKETVVEKKDSGRDKYYNDDLVTKELFYLQTDSTHDSIGDIVSNLNEELNTSLLTVTGNGTVSGTLGVTGTLSSSAYVSAPYFVANGATATSTLAGALAVGTTTDNAELTLDGVAYLANVSAPGTTANRLYSVGGSLYWAGSLVGGGSVGSWTTDGTHVWRATGNVGIGTTSPAAKLSVGGTNVEVNIGGYFGAGYGAISLNGTTGSNTYNFLSGNSVTDNSLYINRPTGGNIHFKENNGTTQMVITTGGNVGIGTTTPTHKLTVAGDIGPESDDSYNLGAAGSDWGCLYYDGGTQGICASDKRLKDNIETLSFSNEDNTALEKLSDLTISTFNFKNAPGSTYTGLIAQEVLEVAPELVILGDDGYYRVKYGDIQWLTLEAVQELNERTLAFESLTEALQNSSSSALLGESVTETFWGKLVQLTQGFVDEVLTLGRADITYVKSEIVEAKNIKVDEELCIGKTCVTENQLKDLLKMQKEFSYEFTDSNDDASVENDSPESRSPNFSDNQPVVSETDDAQVVKKEVQDNEAEKIETEAGSDIVIDELESEPVLKEDKTTVEILTNQSESIEGEVSAVEEESTESTE